VYTNGNSETCIGKYFAANPDMRKKVFLATKASGAHDAAGLEEKLQASMNKMNTNYIDVFYGVHGLNNTSQLTDEFKSGRRTRKKEGSYQILRLHHAQQYGEKFVRGVKTRLG